MNSPAAEPRVITVKRYVCPFCSRGHSKPVAAAAHIARCWKNPATRSCTTCKFFEQVKCCGMPDVYGCYTPMCPDTDTCGRGVSLAEGSPVSGCELWAVSS